MQDKLNKISELVDVLAQSTPNSDAAQKVSHHLDATLTHLHQAVEVIQKQTSTSHDHKLDEGTLESSGETASSIYGQTVENEKIDNHSESVKDSVVNSSDVVGQYNNIDTPAQHSPTSDTQIHTLLEMGIDAPIPKPILVEPRTFSPNLVDPSRERVTEVLHPWAGKPNPLREEIGANHAPYKPLDVLEPTEDTSPVLNVDSVTTNPDNTSTIHLTSVHDDTAHTPSVVSDAPPAALSTKVAASAVPTTYMSEETRLPNANVGRPYSANIQALVLAKATLPDGLAISHEKLSGTPRLPGEYRIEWRTNDGSKRGVLLLTVNADPRSLWKDLPSDQKDRYWKSDEVSASCETPEARAVVASVRGRSHAHVGSFRDDDFAIKLEAFNDSPNQGWNILVVADGAGSARFSRRGSYIACQAVVKHLEQTLKTPLNENLKDLRAFQERTFYAIEKDKEDTEFWRTHLYQIFAPAIKNAQDKVREEAKLIGAHPKDFHTTLLVAIVRRTMTGSWFVGTYWIGDGAIGMWDNRWTSPKLFGEVDSGEFAGETTFLTHEDFTKINRRLRYTIVPSFSYLALMTDGISDPKFDAEMKLKSADAWQDFTDDLTTATDGASLSELTEAQLLEWMNFWSQGNHDDRTLLLFQPRIPTEGTP